uniref:Tail protein n=1 Tax=viral metagenome TaxID=1070528 RepID=A0A6H1ZQ07_9ZZZZ
MARLAGYGGDVYVGDLVVQNCDVAWTEQVDLDVTLTLDNTDYKVGSGSNKMLQGAGLANGDILASQVIALPTLAAYAMLFCWAKSSVNIATADDYRLLLDNQAMCANPEVECSLPVLVANVWKFCMCPVVTGSFAAATLPISVGLELHANDPGPATMWIDYITAGRQVAGIRSWSLDVTASVQDVSAYSDGQDKVFAVTTKAWSGSFEGFKDGAPLAIGTVVGLELQESAMATQMWRGSAIITNIRPAVSVDGLVGYAYDFQGIHALEWPTA